MDLRRVCESQETKDNECAADLDRKGSEVESSGNVIGSGRTSEGPKDNGHSVLNSVSKILSIKKPQHRRNDSPLNWFPRRKIDSYLKRKIRILQENEGMNLSLDETLGNASLHYTRIAREKIAAREAARKAMEARKAAMVEASWCRVLQAARIQTKEAEVELEKAETYAREAFETAREMGVMMYDKSDSPRRPCKVKSHSSIDGKSTHKVTASFETAFDVDKEVMAAIKRAFIQLANCPPSSNKEEFKDLLWKISQNPEDGVTYPEISSEPEVDEDFSSDDQGNAQVTEKKQKKCNCRQLPNDHDKRSAKSFTELVNAMLNRLEGLHEDELASLATIVATCGLNAALLELEHSKDQEQGTRGERRNSNATHFMAGYLNGKEPDTEVPSLDKFLVKHVSQLEREVQEARNSRYQQAPGISEEINTDTKSIETEPFPDLGSILVKHVSRLEREVQEARKARHQQVPGTSEVINTESKSIATGPFPDLRSILVKHVSKLEKEIQETRKSNKNNFLADNEKTAVLSGSILHEKENKELRNSQRPRENMKKANMGFQETVSSNQDKENIDCNTLTVLSVVTEGKYQAGKLTGTNGQTPFGTENELELEHMKPSPGKHISLLERAKQEVLNSFSAQEQTSLDKILVKPIHRLEREKMQALERVTEYAMKRDQQKHGADATASESLDKVLVKHVSRLEKERMASRTEYDPISTVKRRDEQPVKMESLDEILVKHQLKLEKAKLAASQQPLYDAIQHRKQTEVVASDSFDEILVRHQPEFEKVKLAAAQQSEGYTKRADSRKEARERELQEAWGGLSLGNSIRPHISRLERDRAAWKREENEEKNASKGNDEII